MSAMEDLLAKIPDTAVRVQVVDDLGKLRWRARDGIKPGDRLNLNDIGEPITMDKSPGRPKTVRVPKRAGPMTPEMTEERLEEIIAARAEAIHHDRLLATIQSNPEKADVLNYVMEGIAEEAAALAFERQLAEEKGDHTSQISARRIVALKGVGDAWLRRKEQAAAAGVDLDSPAFARLLGFVIETFQAAMVDAVIHPASQTTVMTKLARRMADDTDWRNEAQKKIHGS